MEATVYHILHLENDAPLPEPTASVIMAMANSRYRPYNGVQCLRRHSDGKIHFPTVEEALQVAKEFKFNPRSHKQFMSNDDVVYWQEQRFTVVKRTITLEIMGEV